MNSLFRACYTDILPRTGHIGVRNCICRISAPPLWKTGSENTGFSIVNLEFSLTRFVVRDYSSKSKKSSQTKCEPKAVMKEEKKALFFVRKGDLVGVYKSLSECQMQVGTSVTGDVLLQGVGDVYMLICDPPVSIYKGYSMAKDTEEYLCSFGLKNSLYTIRAADLTQELFGTLVPCPFQQPSSGSEISALHTVMRSHEMMCSEYGQRSCTLEFDGSSKGNPGRAGAGAILRADDGSWTCRLREGLGIATCNAAEYRAIILGLRYALQKGFTSVRVQGNSKLVCMQTQGRWKVKNQNMSIFHKEVKKLKDRFLSFQIVHVLRGLNSEADVQANLAVDLADGQVQEEIDK